MMALLLAGAALAGTTEVVSWDFESSNGDFTSYGETGQWEWGPVKTGPLSGHSGSNAWGTGLNRPYYNDTIDYLGLPTLNLSDLTRPILEFYEWYAIDPNGDAGWLEVLDGGVWTRVDPIYGYPEADGVTGTSGGWVCAWLDLAGLTDLSQVRFVFSSNATVALEGWFIDDVRVVDGDPAPPEITVVTAPTDTQDLVGPYPVQATLDDNGGIPSARLLWSTEDATNHGVDMTEGTDGLWTGEIPAQPANTRVTWSIQATDGENNASAPADGTYLFRVYLAPPTGLIGPSGQVVATDATLTWQPPTSPHPVLYYRVYDTGIVVAEPTEPTATVPLTESFPTFEVSAVYDVGEGDRSSALVIHASVPTVSDVTPTEAWQGDALRIAVSGEYLLLTDTDASLDLGDGIAVENVAVTDADHATFTVQVDDDAQTGVRQGTLVSGDQEIPLGVDFTLHDGADRPALVSIDPASATQGDQLAITLQTNTPIADTPTVDLGDGIIIESVTSDGETATVQATIGWDAPVGKRTVTLDDGQRILSGATFRVRNATTAPQTTCATAGSRPTRLWLLLLGLALLRRRRQLRLG